jgi:HD-GYP domain-containing protein (c-di-GMP phosphodiesterase class II)
MRFETYDDLVGKRLLHPVANASGVMLFPEGWILSKEDTEKLKNFRIDPYDIYAEEVPQEESEDHAQDDVRAFLTQTESKMAQLENAVLKTGQVPVSELEDMLPSLMRTTRNRNVYKLFNELKAGEDRRYRRMIGVSILSSLIGRWMNMEKNDLSLLTLAASLCDVGMLKLPSSIVNKTTRLETHEIEIMKQHTTLGYELLKKAEVDERVALVALQHHEREDGSGYPQGLKGNELDYFSKIVAIADKYVELTTDQPHRPRQSFYEAIHELHEEILNNRFDQTIGMTFLNRLMTSQVGSEVVLSDDRVGKIMLINANYPACPIVAVGSELVDLSQNRNLKIMEIVG